MVSGDAISEDEIQRSQRDDRAVAIEELIESVEGQEVHGMDDRVSLSSEDSMVIHEPHKGTTTGQSDYYATYAMRLHRRGVVRFGGVRVGPPSGNTTVVLPPRRPATNFLLTLMLLFGLLLLMIGVVY